MACDLQFTLNGVQKTKGKTKIFLIQAHEMHCHEDFLLGFAGAASDIIDVVDYFERPELYKSCPRTKNLSGLILTRSGKIFQWDTPSKWLAVTDQFAAMGSGGPTALGAMHMGATPLEAVRAAMKVDPFTGMGTKRLSFV